VEGALPVHIFDLCLDTDKGFAYHQFLEPLLHAFLVVFFRHSLHSVQEFMGYAMVQQLKNVQRKEKKTSIRDGGDQSKLNINVGRKRARHFRERVFDKPQRSPSSHRHL